MAWVKHQPTAPAEAERQIAGMADVESPQTAGLGLRYPGSNISSQARCIEDSQRKLLARVGNIMACGKSNPVVPQGRGTRNMRSFVVLVINAGSGQDQTIGELVELIARVGLGRPIGTF